MPCSEPCSPGVLAEGSVCPVWSCQTGRPVLHYFPAPYKLWNLHVAHFSVLISVSVSAPCLYHGEPALQSGTQGDVMQISGILLWASLRPRHPGPPLVLVSSFRLLTVAGLPHSTWAPPPCRGLWETPPGRNLGEHGFASSMGHSFILLVAQHLKTVLSCIFSRFYGFLTVRGLV